EAVAAHLEPAAAVLGDQVGHAVEARVADRVIRVPDLLAVALVARRAEGPVELGAAVARLLLGVLRLLGAAERAERARLHGPHLARAAVALERAVGALERGLGVARQARERERPQRARVARRIAKRLAREVGCAGVAAVREEERLRRLGPRAGRIELARAQDE